MTTGYETLDKALREAIAPAIREGLFAIAEAVENKTTLTTSTEPMTHKSPEQVLEDSLWDWTGWAPMLQTLEDRGFKIVQEKQMTVGQLGVEHLGKRIQITKGGKVFDGVIWRIEHAGAIDPKRYPPLTWLNNQKSFPPDTPYTIVEEG